MSEDKPEFGFGAAGRPLWTVRDRGAEAIRAVLRKAGRREFGERQDGFVVEGGSDGAPFVIACTGDAEVAAPELARYEAALLEAGYRVEPDPADDQVLQARSPS
ncbi:hypothetical protein [Streptosporangium roseum]|uniref:hypothetical protein n=1 Tax=Streptosporangium roseum TaxID=2001 RepID=UPI00332CA1CF